jgi:hypothetical protein
VTETMMRELVGKHERDRVLRKGLLEQAGTQIDVAAGEREGLGPVS